MTAKSGALGSRISAGVLDSAVFSLNGFVIGLSATLLLTPELLGVFAVFFSVYVLAREFPTELVFVPASIAAVRLPESDRTGILYSSLRSGGIVALGTSFVTLIAVPVTASVATPNQLIGMTVATFAAAVLGPTEEHIRLVLHLAGRSWAALAASGAMLASSVASVVVLSTTEIERTAISLGALAIANGASLITGLALARPRKGAVDPTLAELRSLLPVGRWLALAGALPAGAEFVISVLVTTLAGAVYLGYAEAARVVAQPIIVLSTGLARVLGPQLMKAGQERSPDLGRSARRIFLWLVPAGTVGYIMLTGWEWVLNPFSHLVPAAYEIAGLVAVTVLANGLIGIGLSDRSVLLGGGGERAITKTEVGAVVLSVAAALSAPYTRAFARPLSRLVSSLFRTSLYRRQVKAMFASPPDEREPGKGRPHGV